MLSKLNVRLIILIFLDIFNINYENRYKNSSEKNLYFLIIMNLLLIFVLLLLLYQYIYIYCAFIKLNFIVN